MSKRSIHDSAGRYKALADEYRLAAIEALMNLRGRPIDFLSPDEYMELPSLARAIIESAETSRKEARAALLSVAKNDHGFDKELLAMLEGGLSNG